MCNCAVWGLKLRTSIPAGLGVLCVLLRMDQWHVLTYLSLSTVTTVPYTHLGTLKGDIPQSCLATRASTWQTLPWPTREGGSCVERHHFASHWENLSDPRGEEVTCSEVL